MDCSEANLIKLIECYRNQSILWDPLNKNHFNKNMKADSWRKISAEMDISAEYCKKKIISLLSSYRREKSKLKSKMGTVNGRDEVYVSRWFAYEAFKFLEDRDVPRKGLTTETDEIRVIGNGVKISEESQKETTASTSTPRLTKRIKLADSKETMISSAFDLLKNAAENLNKEPKPNEIDTFFTYVAAKVNKYSTETQKSVQHAVFDILVKADKGYFDWAAPNAQHSNNWQNPPESEPHPHHYVLQTLQPVPTPIESPSDSLTASSAQRSPAASIISDQFLDFV